MKIVVHLVLKTVGMYALKPRRGYSSPLGKLSRVYQAGQLPLFLLSRLAHSARLRPPKNRQSDSKIASKKLALFPAWKFHCPLAAITNSATISPSFSPRHLPRPRSCPRPSSPLNFPWLPLYLHGRKQDWLRKAADFDRLLALPGHQDISQ